jgi:hypothetical protein
MLVRSRTQTAHADSTDNAVVIRNVNRRQRQVSKRRVGWTSPQRRTLLFLAPPSPPCRQTSHSQLQPSVRPLSMLSYCRYRYVSTCHQRWCWLCHGGQSDECSKGPRRSLLSLLKALGLQRSKTTTELQSSLIISTDGGAASTRLRKRLIARPD